jgi:adenylyl-sulfate kinase
MNNNIFKKPKSKDIIWHHPKITKEDRERRQGHKGVVIWFTGLPSSGKSTIANELSYQLFKRRCNVYVLDGDNIRHGLNRDLGFSPEDRVENIRRIGEVAKLLADAGMIVMTAFVSPYKADRDKVRKLLKQGEFIEVFVSCPPEVCEKRDPKGHYKKAKEGLIPEFTGVSAPYEPPENPEIVLYSDEESVVESVARVIWYLEQHGIIE